MLLTDALDTSLTRHNIARGEFPSEREAVWDLTEVSYFRWVYHHHYRLNLSVFNVMSPTKIVFDPEQGRWSKGYVGVYWRWDNGPVLHKSRDRILTYQDWAFSRDQNLLIALNVIITRHTTSQSSTTKGATEPLDSDRKVWLMSLALALEEKVSDAM